MEFIKAKVYFINIINVASNIFSSYFINDRERKREKILCKFQLIVFNYISKNNKQFKTKQHDINNLIEVLFLIINI
jgi:hypothetical protein